MAHRCTAVPLFGVLAGLCMCAANPTAPGDGDGLGGAQHARRGPAAAAACLVSSTNVRWGMAAWHACTTLACKPCSAQLTDLTVPNALGGTRFRPVAGAFVVVAVVAVVAVVVAVHTPRCQRDLGFANLPHTFACCSMCIAEGSSEPACHPSPGCTGGLASSQARTMWPTMKHRAQLSWQTRQDMSGSVHGTDGPTLWENEHFRILHTVLSKASILKRLPCAGTGN